MSTEYRFNAITARLVFTTDDGRQFEVTFNEGHRITIGVGMDDLYDDVSMFGGMARVAPADIRATVTVTPYAGQENPPATMRIVGDDAAEPATDAP